MARKTYNNRFKMPNEPASDKIWLFLTLVAGWLFFDVSGLAKVIAGVGAVAAYGAYKKNKERRHLNRRFQQYCAVIGSRNNVSVMEFCRATGESSKTVRDNLQKMVSEGYFGKEAFFNVKEDMLVVNEANRRASAGVYNWVSMIGDLFDSLRNMGVEVKDDDSIETEFAADPAPAQASNLNASQKRQPDAKPAQEAPKAETKATSAEKTYMDELERTLQELYELNEQIADEGVSCRIDRIGELTAAIFRAVIESPKREPDVRKFMNYYLPTTLKLLKSYDMLEDQRYQGENIVASRKKIENVLDMLIEGFEKQIDRLYQDVALDIATDVDVLETMMAGDGLSSKGQMPFV